MSGTSTRFTRETTLVGLPASDCVSHTYACTVLYCTPTSNRKFIQIEPEQDDVHVDKHYVVLG